MAAAPIYSQDNEMLYCRANNQQHLPYHTSMFSSSVWNSNEPASQVPSLIASSTTTTTTTTTAGSKKDINSENGEGQISPCSFTSSEDNDPMLGYPWNRADAAPPSPPVYAVSEYSSCGTAINSISSNISHSSNNNNNNSSSEGISATITSSSPTVLTMWPPSSCKTPLDFSSSFSPEKNFIGQQQQQQQQQQQLPLSPESLYASPLLPPSSGIVSTSDILDDATSLELPSLFIMSKEPSFSSTADYCPQILNDSSSGSGSPALSSTSTTDDDDEAPKTDDMDWCFSSSEEEEDDQVEEETYCQADEDEEDDVFAHWPDPLTRGISFSSSIESEYDEYEEEDEEDTTTATVQNHHPLNRLLADLREQVNTKQRLKEHEWIALYQHAKEILDHDDANGGDDLLPAIRQCVLEYVKVLRARYEPIFSIYGDEEEDIDIDDDVDDEAVEEEDDEYNDDEEEEEKQVPVVTRRRSRSRQPSQRDVAATTISSAPSSIATATSTIRRRKRKIEESSDEEEEDDDPWVPEEAEEEEVTVKASSTTSSARRRQRQPSTSSVTSSSSSSSSRRSSTCSSSSTSYHHHRNTKKTRQNYSRETTRVLMNWYLLHGGKTPEPEHKEILAKEAKKSHVQISTWFQNARRRHHSKLVQFQKLSQAHPDQVYDYDSLLAFTEQANKSSKKSAIIPTDAAATAAEDDTDNDVHDDNYDDDDDEEAGSSSSYSSPPNKRLRTEEP